MILASRAPSRKTFDNVGFDVREGAGSGPLRTPRTGERQEGADPRPYRASPGRDRRPAARRYAPETRQAGRSGQVSLSARRPATTGCISGGRREGGDAHLPAPGEAQRLIERQGSGVVGHHMQERRFVPRLDPSRNPPGQGGIVGIRIQTDQRVRRAFPRRRRVRRPGRNAGPGHHRSRGRTAGSSGRPRLGGRGGGRSSSSVVSFVVGMVRQPPPTTRLHGRGAGRTPTAGRDVEDSDAHLQPRARGVVSPHRADAGARPDASASKSRS